MAPVPPVQQAPHVSAVSAESSAQPALPKAPEAASTRALAARVRTSKHLSRTTKRYWLTVLPHLTLADQARLDAILRGETAPGS